MRNADIANIFNAIADILEIRGENPFRIRAYQKAAFTVGTLGRDISLLTKDELLSLPGIGKDLSAKITEYLETGKIRAFEQLSTEVPKSLVTLLKVPGVGPKRAAMFFKEQGIATIDQLEAAARKHRLSGLPGIKDRTEMSILKGIAMIRRFSDRHPLGRIRPRAEEIIAYLKGQAPVSRIEVAGSIRRWKDTVRDIDVVCTSKKPDEVMRVFTGMPGVSQVAARGTTKSSVVIAGGIQVDLRVVEEGSFGAALAYFTGSKTHNVKLREMAVRAGMKLNEYGLFREKDNRKLGGRTEEEIYRILGLSFIPPELREDTGEVEASRDRRLPDLVELKHIRGDLHLHSSWSDGTLDIEDVVQRPIEKGYRYALLTDHTRGLGVARGLGEDRILEQKKRIDSLNRRLKGFRLLAGAEVNIRNDGSLDLDDDLLKQLDLVVASVHSGFSQTKEQMTRRIVTAMQNPFVSIIGHPSGRLIGEREAYQVDMEAVVAAAAETGTAIEINAYPLRLDLADSFARIAGERGVMLAISTDAHNEGQLETMVYGVAVARRAWIGPKSVANTLPLKGLLQRLRRQGRPRRGGGIRQRA